MRFKCELTVEEIKQLISDAINARCSVTVAPTDVIFEDPCLTDNRIICFISKEV